MEKPLSEYERIFAEGIQYALDNYMPLKPYCANCCIDCEAYKQWEKECKEEMKCQL